ncbi:lipocalin family protein [Maribacter sp. CXY002]|uniref:lipocalin family protein n=1 Tax=Maribacter luteocoastalis TaxID=3407671 RepID=UPI003B6791BC
MKNWFIMLLTFTLISCSEKVAQEDLTLINGYWEITKVILPDGNNKEYKVSTSIDFFKIDGLKGYRKKVIPKFDGSFETSDDAELFTINRGNDLFQIQYKNNLTEWQEHILLLSEEKLVLANGEAQYHYKRFEPINITL